MNKLLILISYLMLTILTGSIVEARDLNKYIDTEIKRAYINHEVTGQQIDVAVSLYNSDMNNLVPANNSNGGLSPSDAALSNISPIQAGENLGAFDRQDDGVKSSGNDIEAEVARKQAYEKSRENYRKALQTEFVRRAALDGVQPNINIADELKRLEKVAATR